MHRQIILQQETISKNYGYICLLEFLNRETQNKIKLFKTVKNWSLKKDKNSQNEQFFAKHGIIVPRDGENKSR